MLGQYRGTLALQLLNLVQHNTFFNIKDHLAPLINKKIQPVVLVEISFRVKNSCYCQLHRKSRL